MKHLDCVYESDSRFEPGEVVYCYAHRECLERDYKLHVKWNNYPRHGRHERPLFQSITGDYVSAWWTPDAGDLRLHT